jgi:hypothetical protein
MWITHLDIHVFILIKKAEYKFSSNFSEEQKYHLNKTVTLSLSIHSDGGLWK